jgi:hypothetical protein
MYHRPCLVLIVLLLADTEIPFEEQVLVAGTKQKKGWKTDLLLRCACYLHSLFQVYILPTYVPQAIYHLWSG